MAQGLIGVNGVPRNISEVKVGVNGVRNVTNMYVGVNGSPRLCWSGNKWANKMYVVCYTPDVTYVGLHIYDPLTSARTLVKSVPKTDRDSAFARNFVTNHPMGGIKYFYGWKFSKVLAQIDPETYAVTQQITVPYYSLYYIDWGLRSIVAIPDGSIDMKRYDPKTLAVINSISTKSSGTGYSSDDTLFGTIGPDNYTHTISKTVFTKIPEPSVFTTDRYYITDVPQGGARRADVTDGKYYQVHIFLGTDDRFILSTFDKNTKALVSRFSQPFPVQREHDMIDFMKE